LQRLPVIIYSTSLNQEMVNLLYEGGARHYIRKPGDFSKLKKVILEALTITSRDDPKNRSKENFIIEA
jgi:DNA-binding NtrC family response regulator